MQNLTITFPQNDTFQYNIFFKGKTNIFLVLLEETFPIMQDSTTKIFLNWISMMLAPAANIGH